MRKMEGFSWVITFSPSRHLFQMMHTKKKSKCLRCLYSLIKIIFLPFPAIYEKVFVINTTHQLHSSISVENNAQISLKKTLMYTQI